MQWTNEPPGKAAAGKIARPTSHVAQVNIGRMKALLTDPVMAGFVERLDEVNALADNSPGFVWRLQTDEGNATYLRPYDDDRILINMSVWETVETLREYVYRTAHAELLRGRHAWFEQFAGSYLALWWVPAGHIPDMEEAKKRLAYLDTHGPTAFAFTFKRAFQPDEMDTTSSLVLDLVDWVARREPTYWEAMDAWRTSCPRLPIWEDANDLGFVTMEHRNGQSKVRVTPMGLALLDHHRPAAKSAVP